MPDSLCTTCQHGCTPTARVEMCSGYEAMLPDVYEPSRKPTTHAAIDAFLREYERAKTLHDWSGYDLLKAARKVLCEAAEFVHAVEHYDEGRDTIEHVIEELNHVGGTAIRVREMIGREGK